VRFPSYPILSRTWCVRKILKNASLRAILFLIGECSSNRGTGADNVVGSWNSTAHRAPSKPLCKAVCFTPLRTLHGCPGRSAVKLYACTHKVRRWRSRANPSCSTSLKGSLTTRFSNRTHTSHGETLVTSPIAPAGMFTGGSSSHLSLTRCPTAKFSFLMVLETANIFILHPHIILSAGSKGASN
jgi:hypothetical protein